MTGVDRPLLLDLPDQFTTERLLIRVPRAGDGPAIHEAVMESLEDLRPWMDWAHPIPALLDSESYARRSAAHFAAREEVPLLLFRRQDGQFVGGSGLHTINWSVPAVEIGYWVRSSLQGEGYITEAVRGITRYAFEHLGALRAEIRCDARNLRSAAVARRAGFTQEGQLRSDGRLPDGSLRNTLIFGRLPGDPAV